MREAVILVVDDSPTIINLVSKTLEHHVGTKTILTATNGKEALKVLKTNKVDIVISDWNMPEMDGEELLYQVRNDPLHEGLPFIIMTTNSARDFIVTAIQLGATNYLVKPFTPKDLEEKLRFAWSSFCKRNKPRFVGLPEHCMEIRIDQKIITGQVVDISQTGVLLCLENDPSLSLFKNCELTLYLIDPDGIDSHTALISSLFGVIVRIEAQDSFHPTSQSCYVGIYINPTKIDKDVSAKLYKVIKWLRGKVPDAIHDRYVKN